MKSLKIILLISVISFFGLVATGCWDYREIDKMAIVAGVAIDKGIQKKYLVTTEIVQTSSGKDSQVGSTLISAEGDSMFDAIRNMMSFSGMRLYWSHAKVIIISEEVARGGCLNALDWFSRDAETRFDIRLLISRATPAKSILEAKKATEEVHSFELNDILTTQKNLGKAPAVELWRFINALASKGASAITASVAINHESNEDLPIVMGTAVFKKDKLVGFLSGEETRELLIIQNKFRRGVLLYKKQGDGPVALEVFNGKTKTKPVVNGDNVEMNLRTYLDTAIDEIESKRDYIEEGGRKELEHGMGKIEETKIEQLIKKVQNEYKADIFGFGSKLYEEDPKLWKQISGNWDERFQDLKVNVDVEIHVRNSAMLSKNLKVGD